MELLLVSLAGCTGMDVIDILRKKRQAVEHYAVEARATQMPEHPNAFTRIDVTHVIEGVGLDAAAVARAIELSATRYCAVGTTLASGMVEIHNGYRIIDTETGSETESEVLVEGPNRVVAGAAAD